MGKAQARFKHWEREAKAGIGKIASAEKEMDEDKEEAQHDRLVAVAAGNVKALVEDTMARVQDALAIMEEARLRLRLRLRLPTWRLNELHSCWRLGG